MSSRFTRQVILAAISSLLWTATTQTAPALDETDDDTTYDVEFAGRKVKQIALGYFHVCTILEDDAVKCWGQNDKGQLGLGDTRSRGAQASEMGANLPDVKLPTTVGTVVKVVGGGWHTCALFSSGSVSCWGEGVNGQLGSGATTNLADTAATTPDKNPLVNLGTGFVAQDISAGGRFTCALSTAGAVRCWGLNATGQLGIGNTTNMGVSAQTIGDNLMSVNLGTGRTAKRVVGGWQHTCAILDNDSLKCWGEGVNGKLGSGTSSIGTRPTDMGDALRPVNLGDGVIVKSVALNYSHTCALLDSGRIKCWGANGRGELGQGDTNERGSNAAATMGNALAPVKLGAGNLAATIVATGYYASCVRMMNNAVKCWGAQDNAHVGSEGNTNLGIRAEDMGESLPFVDLGRLAQVKQLVMNWSSVCALLNTGKAKCWGSNTSGVLGHGTNNASQRVGNQPGQMGDALPFSLVD